MSWLTLAVAYLIAGMMFLISYLMTFREEQPSPPLSLTIIGWPVVLLIWCMLALSSAGQKLAFAAASWLRGRTKPPEPTAEPVVQHKTVEREVVNEWE